MTIVVLGAASLDLVRQGSRVSLSFGGVAKNVACALAERRQTVRLVTPGHEPEWRAALAEHLQARGVIWRPWNLIRPLPLYEAVLEPNGDVRRERFYDNGAFAALQPAWLEQTRADWLADAELVIATSDLHARSLKALGRLCRVQQVAFGVISSSVAKAGRLRGLDTQLLALNLAELQHLEPQAANLRTQARAVAGLLGPAGAGLLTLGAAGAMLVLPTAGQALLQPVPLLRPASTVGAGDTLFASLVEARCRRLEWPEALAWASAQTLAFLDPGQRLGLPPQRRILLA